MRVQDLIEFLEQLDAPDAEVRLASQPNWPFEYSVADITYISNEDRDAEPVDDECGCNGRCNECNATNHKDCPMNESDEPRQPEPGDDVPITVYLVSGNQIGYLPGSVCRLIGWK